MRPPVRAGDGTHVGSERMGDERLTRTPRSALGARATVEADPPRPPSTSSKRDRGVGWAPRTMSRRARRRSGSSPTETSVPTSPAGRPAAVTFTGSGVAWWRPIARCRARTASKTVGNGEIRSVRRCDSTCDRLGAARCRVPFDPELAERIRRRLDGVEGLDVREVAMFGGRSFMVHEQLAVCAASDGALLVRCAPEEADRLVQQPGARPAEMRGRPMSQGWLRVDIEALADEPVLDGWIVSAVAHARRRAGTT